MIKIGTSGFNYDDWRDFFYPNDLSKEQFLSYYSDRFDVLELDFSYYQMPTANQFDSILKQSDGKLEFSVKAHKSMTHERTAGRADIAQFQDAIAPLRDAGKLGAVLAQFPSSFAQTTENRAYIKHLVDNLGSPLIVELRHMNWTTDPIINWLAKLGVGYCCVDEPQIKGLMPPVARAAAQPAYVRFHGRNATKWYRHNQPHERFDYRYNPRELQGWAQKIKLLESEVGKVMVFFNNHFQAKAVEGAKMLKVILRSLNPDSATQKPV